MAYTQVNLSDLPAPNIIEDVSFEDILAEMKDACVLAMPSLGPVLALESETATKVLEVCAAYVMMVRARVNDAAKAVLLAYASGSDLDHLGALFGVERAVVQVEDIGAGLAEILEDDASFRIRIQISLEGFSVAGPRGAYEFHARSVSADVKDVAIIGPGNPALPVNSGYVHVYVLSGIGNGEASPALVEAVNDALSADDVRPLTDTVVTASATILPFAVSAQIEVFDGPDTSVVLAEAEDALTQYLESVHAIGATVAVSGIHGALHRPGVRRVVVTSPPADITPAPNVAPYASTVTITVAE